MFQHCYRSFLWSCASYLYNLWYTGFSPYTTCASQHIHWQRQVSSIVEGKLDLKMRLKSSAELNQCVLLQQSVQQYSTHRTAFSPSVTYPTDICCLICQRWRARKVWQYQVQLKINGHLTGHRVKLLRLSISGRTTLFRSYLSKLAPNKEAGYSLWKVTERLRQFPMKKFLLKKEDGIWAHSDQERVQLFAQYYFNSFQTNKVDSDVKSVPLPLDSGRIKPTSSLEVARLLARQTDSLKVSWTTSYPPPLR